MKIRSDVKATYHETCTATRCAVIVMAFFLSTASHVQATVGCMDTSKYLDRSDGYDYKTLHYVECSCPCERYHQDQKRGLCMQCLHTRKTADFVAW